jgi:hypothetical protein
MMASGTDGDLVGHFRIAYESVVRYPVLIAPPLAVGVLGFALLAVVFLVVGGATVMGGLLGGLQGSGELIAVAGIAGLILAILVFGLVMGLLWLLSSCMVVVMARDALDGREPGLASALSAVLGRMGAVVWASSLVTIIVGVAFLFLVIPGLVAAVLLVFTLPAVLLDGFGAVAAMKHSVAIVRRHVGPVIGFVVGSLLTLVGVAIASWILGFIPFLGALASFVLHGAALSYLTVVAVRFYRALATVPRPAGSGA